MLTHVILWTCGVAIILWALAFLLALIIKINDWWWLRKYRLDVERKRGTRPVDWDKY